MLGFDLATLKQSRFYQEVLEEGRQEIRREFMECALKTRFGDLDESLAAIVAPLLTLPPDEVMPLLFNQSREELIARFTPDPTE